MRNLFNFLIQYSVLVLFLILEVTSIFLVVSNQEYQKSVFLSSSNNVVSKHKAQARAYIEYRHERDLARQSKSEWATLGMNIS